MSRLFRWIRTSGLVCAGCALVVAGELAHAQTTAAPVANAATIPAPIYWKQDLFLIPYQLTGGSAGFAQSVRLVASHDRGASWTVISEAKPHVKAFNYRAPGDGEYWFAVRTIDSAGRTWPSSANQPELRVIVDRTPPRIDGLRAKSRDDGTLEIEWSETDANLNVAASRAEVQSETNGPWIPATVLPVAGPQNSGLRQVTWRSPTGRPGVSVRASITDLAGNIATATGPVETAVHAPALPVAAASSFPPSWTSAASLSGKSDALMPMNAAASPPSAQPWPAQSSPALAYRLFDNTLTPPVDGATRYGNPIDARTAGEPTNATGDRYAAGAEFTPLEPYRQASLRRLPEIGVNSASSTEQVPTVPTRTVSVSQNPHEPPAPSDPRSRIELPAGVEPKKVAARTFALEYDLAGLGRWGVSRVELWGTENGGKTWRRFAQDDDLRSPITVTVDGEGLYGFSIVAESAGSAPVSPPQAGQMPELWVDVDLHRPFAELTEIHRGTGNQADQIVLRWRAVDDNLLSRPVALFYSSRPAGPWSVIAAELENTGEYSWRIERHVPERCYLRLEVRDAAGHRAAYQTLEPIELASVQPQAQLRSAEPATSSAAAPVTSPR